MLKDRKGKSYRERQRHTVDMKNEKNCKLILNNTPKVFQTSVAIATTLLKANLLKSLLIAFAALNMNQHMDYY